ncbi:MAG: hypothetical protein ACE37F_27460 [Nannocystaceae bacterium]|nr:hypothetical protein [bacterium]
MRTLLVITVVSLSLAACSSSETKSETAAPANQKDGGKEAKTDDGAAAGADKKVKVVEGAAPDGDDRYALKIETPDAQSGKESKVTVRVVPKEPWHMNLDFPTSLKLDPPAGVTVANADLKKADAKLDESACQFDVAFTPSAAGEQTFTGKFKFAVCQDEACSPVTEDIEFKVAVK